MADVDDKEPTATPTPEPRQHVRSADAGMVALIAAHFFATQPHPERLTWCVQQAIALLDEAERQLASGPAAAVK